jgi:hypothetical protein
MDALRNIIDFIASYPLWAKFLITGGVIVTIFTLIFAQRLQGVEQTAMYGVKINSPQGGDTVPWSFPVVGSFEKLPDSVDLWVITTDSSGQRYWPQERAIPRTDKTWSARVHGIGGEIGDRRTFGVFLVGPDGQALLDLWKKAAANKSTLELTRLTHDIQKVHEVDVVVGSGRP